jgi:hypothetical protein
VTIDKLTSTLAERVLGWSVTPDRFLTGRRGWLPRWRFRPAENADDAFRLLDAAVPERYTMGSAEDGTFWVNVCIGGATGEAVDASRPRAITFAVARAIGLEVHAPA